ncbi:MAG: ATP--guanido phosphotransferase [Planctomycetota bacterium]
MDLRELAGKCGEWLSGSGPESDIVISSRIRLARNLGGFPFVKRASEDEKAQIASLALQKIEQLESRDNVHHFDVQELDDVDRQLLVERQLMSREMADSDGDRCVAVDPLERFSIMINEEDHLRIQVMCSGLDLESAWNQVDTLDNELEQKLDYAFHEQLGYLTACPTNVGTGLRVSVMVHLPALVITREIEKVFRSLQKINVAVRGLYGEGSQFMGDFYQVSKSSSVFPSVI